MKKIFLLILVIIGLGISMDSNAQAWKLEQTSQNAFGAPLTKPEYIPETTAGEAGNSSNIITDLMRTLISVLSGIAAAVAIFFIVVNGFTMASSMGGDRLAKAKKGMMWSIAGLFVIILSYIAVKSLIALTYVK